MDATAQLLVTAPVRIPSGPVSMPPFASFLQEQTQRDEAAQRRAAAKAFAKTIRSKNAKSRGRRGPQM